MANFLSSEIRWFFEGSIPDLVKDNFLRKDRYVFQNREDVYKKFLKTSNTGVKIRDGKFEIKPLVKESEIFKINEEASGNVEIWEKWSSPHVPINFNDSDNENQWLKVRKQRYLRKYHLVDHQILEINPEEELTAGCNFELTSLNTHNKDYWTMSFEAYKERDAHVQFLKDTVVKVMNETNFPLKFLLSDGNRASYSTKFSFSYPSFFASNNYFGKNFNIIIE